MEQNESNKLRAKQRYQNLSTLERKSYIENAQKNFKQWVNDNPIRYRLNLAKDRAKRKKLDFNIDLEYLSNIFEIQNGLCYYSGVKLSQHSDKKFSMSLDRIDSSKGYIKGNVVFVSTIVNLMKNDLVENEFLSVIKLIADYQKGS